MLFLDFCTKRKHTSPTNSEFAKKLVRLSVLEEKLGFCFFSIFGTKRKHTGLTNSENAKKSVRVSVLEGELDLWWKLQFAAQDAKI